MADATTTTYSFTKPEVNASADIWGTKLNANWDSVDDLLMSAGDGTAKPQGDDIVRSKTVAKVTSTHVSHTYPDGSYAVPCVVMAS